LREKGKELLQSLGDQALKKERGLSSNVLVDRNFEEGPNRDKREKGAEG
jgi:hypothetical protein